MRSRILALSAVLLLMVSAAQSVQSTDKEASTANVGKKIADFTLHDDAGKAFSLYDVKDKKAIVIVFLSFECSVSKDYNDILSGLHKQYDKQVAFIGLTTNADDSAAEVAKQAREFKISFPVFKDEKL